MTNDLPSGGSGHELGDSRNQGPNYWSPDNIAAQLERLTSMARGDNMTAGTGPDNQRSDQPATPDMPPSMHKPDTSPAENDPPATQSGPAEGEPQADGWWKKLPPRYSGDEGSVGRAGEKAGDRTEPGPQGQPDSNGDAEAVDADATTGQDGDSESLGQHGSDHTDRGDSEPAHGGEAGAADTHNDASDRPQETDTSDSESSADGPADTNRDEHEAAGTDAAADQGTDLEEAGGGDAEAADIEAAQGLDGDESDRTKQAKGLAATALSRTAEWVKNDVGEWVLQQAKEIGKAVVEGAADALDEGLYMYRSTRGERRVQDYEAWQRDRQRGLRYPERRVARVQRKGDQGRGIQARTQPGLSRPRRAAHRAQLREDYKKREATEGKNQLDAGQQQPPERQALPPGDDEAR